jgi:hypothetical protein
MAGMNRLITEEENQMTFKRWLSGCLLLVFVSLIAPSYAHAYLDPGTGSYIFQLLIAGLVGLGLVVKIYWKRIMAFFTRMISKGEQTDDDQDL